MAFDRSIKVGDILTSLTILVSVSALAVSWSKDRSLREIEHADKVRAAAANALIQLDRWQFINLSLYQELEPTFVEASEMLKNDFNMVKVNDYLYKTINDKRIQIASKILDEKILTTYVDLLSHFPASREHFVTVFEQLRLIEKDVSNEFLLAFQDDVFSFKDKQESYTTTRLGNALRYTAATHREKLIEKYSETIRPIRQFLFDVIAMSNKEILNTNRVLTNS
jgi:hypothetical protein